MKRISVEDEVEYVERNENDEETYSDSDGGDRDYTQGNDPTDDEDDNDNNLDAPTQKPSAKMGKASKRDRSDTLFAEGIRGVQKKKSRQDLRGGEQQSGLVWIDLTGSRVSEKRRLPSTAHPTVSNPPLLIMKATEAQILSTNRATFTLAKPILASFIYINEPWPTSIQRENALCDMAWCKALTTQYSQLKAVGARQALQGSGDVPSEVMDGLTRGVVSSFGNP